MSAGAVLQAAAMARLAGLGRVFDAPPVRGAMPYLVVEDPVLAAGDAAGVAGRTGTITVACMDMGTSPVRVRALIAAAEAAIGGLAADLGGGWRLTAVRLARGQVVAGKNERWTAAATFAVRMYRVN